MIPPIPCTTQHCSTCTTYPTVAKQSIKSETDQNEHFFAATTLALLSLLLRMSCFFRNENYACFVHYHFECFVRFRHHQPATKVAPDFSHCCRNQQRKRCSIFFFFYLVLSFFQAMRVLSSNNGNSNETMIHHCPKSCFHTFVGTGRTNTTQWTNIHTPQTATIGRSNNWNRGGGIQTLLGPTNNQYMSRWQSNRETLWRYLLAGVATPSMPHK